MLGARNEHSLLMIAMPRLTRPPALSQESVRVCFDPQTRSKGVHLLSLLSQYISLQQPGQTLSLIVRTSHAFQPLEHYFSWTPMSPYGRARLKVGIWEAASDSRETC